MSWAVLAVLLSAAPLRADLHEHVTMASTLPLFQHGPGSAVASSADSSMENQIDPQGLLDAGVRVVFATIWTPPDLRPGSSSLGETLRQLRILKALPFHDARFGIALDAAQVEQLAASGRIALVPSIEGAECISSVSDVDTLYAAGVRSVGLVHFVDNKLGDAEDGQFGAVGRPLFDGKTRGLTELGRAVVRRMFELGMLVDVSHGSASLTEEVLALAEHAQVPVIASHAGSAMAMDRTLSDEHARRIAALGGLIGIGPFRHDQLKPVPAADRFEGFVNGTCDESLAHWTHYAKVAGADAVVLGSDLSSVIHRGRPGGSCPKGIRSSKDLGDFFDALAHRGLNDDGARVLPVMRAAEGHADPAARRSATRLHLPADDVTPL